MPAFREASGIAASILKVLTHFGDIGDALEVIVADDGSDDGTPEAAEALGDERVRVVRLDHHRGKGAAVRLGILEAAGAKVLVVDADLAIPLDVYGSLDERLRDGADVVIGSKELGRRSGKVTRPLMRTLMGRAFNLAVRAIVLPGILDTQAGFKLYRAHAAREVARESRLDGFTYDVEMLALARMKGFRVQEVAVDCLQGAHTSVRALIDSIRMLADLARLRRRLGKVRGGVRHA